MSTIYLVQGDTGPQLKFTVTEQTTELPVDLTGATVTLHFRAVGTTTVLFSRAASLVGENPALGIAILQFSSGDLNIPPGHYEGEVEVVLSSGVRQTVYEKIEFVLREDLA